MGRLGVVLQKAIAQTSEEETSEFDVLGVMEGADAAKHTFHFNPDEGEDIRGKFEALIDESHTVELPKRYKIRVRRTAKILYSTEQEDVTYELLSMQPL
jgi:hypothetical protein